ncbi:GtrA domain-containing protein [Pseudarthrobacter sp. MDT3-1]
MFQHGRDRPAAAAGLRYFSLVLVLLAANYGLISAQDSLSVAALPAKILAEIALLAVSYVVQQRFLFPGARPGAPHGRLRIRLWT